MSRLAALCVVAIASVVAACSSIPKAPPGEVTLPDRVESDSIPEGFINYVQAWLQTNRLVAAKKFDVAYPRLSDLMASSLFESLPSTERHKWVFDAASLGREVDDFKHSQGLFVSASEMPEAGLEDWDGRYTAAVRLNDSDDAVYAITTIARRWPESLGDYNSAYIRRLARGAGDSSASEERRMRLLEVLYGNNWKVELGAEPSALWREYVRLLIARGDTPKAQEVLRR
ncbi:MAG TPA: hypothetical protein VGO53_13540, partial [Steroidobacteraceae bacterium]|nr:hypothetical protein [Steroidobacteraceae bacterium]